MVARLVAVGAALAATCLAACATPAAARPVKHQDVVVDAIRRAAARGHITRAEQVSLGSQWRGSGRAVRSLGGARGQAVAAARAGVLAIARRGELTPSRVRGAIASVHATTWVMQHRSWPSYGDRVRIPGDAAVYGYYPGHGMQLQPLHSFTRGNTLWMQGRYDEMAEVADRMIELSSFRSGYRTWEYYFDWQGSSGPWNSAMSQAAALQFFARAWSTTGNEACREMVVAGLPGFAQPAWRGGLSVREGDGRWYLMYPDSRRQRILNGHLQAIIGLLDVGTIMSDARATLLATSGIDAVLPQLHRFDTGAWSRYALGQEASLEYHDLMTSQLDKLGSRTQHATFTTYAERFARYRITSASVVARSRTQHVLYPVRDGYRDRAGMQVHLDKQARVRISVVGADRQTVRSWGVKAARGWHVLEWDGRSRTGTQAPAGSYAVEVRSVDVAGNVGTSSFNDAFTVREDATAPHLVRAVVRSVDRATSILSIRVRDDESPWVTVRVVSGGRVVALRRIRGHARMRLPRSTRALDNATILVTDTSGNRTRVRLSKKGQPPLATAASR